MQRRDAPSSGASSETGDDLYVDQAAWGSAGAGGLFDTDAPTDPARVAKPSSAPWAAARSVPASAASPALSRPVHVGSTKGAPKHPLGSAAADLVARMDSGAQLASGTDAQRQAPSRYESTDQNQEDGGMAGTTQPVARAVAHSTASAGSHKRSSGSGDRSEPSSSMVGNLISTMRSGFTRVMAALPPALRRTLRDGSAGNSIAGSEEEEEEDDGGRTREDIKKDLLLGHLLGLLTEGGEGMPAHALPALASSLADTGLLPRWVQVTINPITPSMNPSSDVAALQAAANLSSLAKTLLWLYHKNPCQHNQVSKVLWTLLNSLGVAGVSGAAAGALRPRVPETLQQGAGQGGSRDLAWRAGWRQRQRGARPCGILGPGPLLAAPLRQGAPCAALGRSSRRRRGLQIPQRLPGDYNSSTQISLPV